MSITVQQVVKTYGAQRALNGVSFSIQKGEVVGFLGPNGAGKSTMMKIITCYIPATQGRVSVCGFDVQERSIDVRRRIGYLPEHNPLYLDMYVREYLHFVGGMYKVPSLKSRVDDMIERVGLQVEAHKKIEALSKGYRQRVGLAQALIHDPEVLILDEPTSGLDPNQLAEIRALIQHIGREKTVMLSTHIMQEVEAICSRAIIIDRGNIVTDRSTAELRRGEVGDRIELDVEFSGRLERGALASIDGVLEVHEVSPQRWVITTTGLVDVRKAVNEVAAAHGLTLLTLTRKEQKLEDVFKQLTGKSVSGA
jgi:ABC-2 type transport system ATP-binding protein